MSGAGFPCTTSSADTTTGKMSASPVSFNIGCTMSLVPPEAMLTGCDFATFRANSTTGSINWASARISPNSRSFASNTASTSSFSP